MAKTNITPEALQTAFKILDQAIEITKSQDATALTSEAAKDDLQKSDDVPDADEVEKAKPFAEMLSKGGYDQAAACDIMVKGGIALNVAQGAYASVIAAANAGKEGGTKTELGGIGEGLQKSEINIQDEIKKSITPFQESLNKGLDSINTIAKSLLEQNEALQKSNTELVEKFEKFAGQSQGRKSITTAAGVDRFQKSQGSNELAPGLEAINIASKSDLKKLVDRLDAENDTIIKKGGESDPLLENAISSIEIANEVPQSAYARIRAMGIVLQRPE